MQRIVGTKVKSICAKDGTEVTCKMVAQKDSDFLKMIIHDSKTWNVDSDDDDCSNEMEEENDILGEVISVPLSHFNAPEITDAEDAKIGVTVYDDKIKFRYVTSPFDEQTLQSSVTHREANVYFKRMEKLGWEFMTAFDHPNLTVTCYWPKIITDDTAEIISEITGWSKEVALAKCRNESTKDPKFCCVFLGGEVYFQETSMSEYKVWNWQQVADAQRSLEGWGWTFVSDNGPGTRMRIITWRLSTPELTAEQIIQLSHLTGNTPDDISKIRKHFLKGLDPE